MRNVKKTFLLYFIACYSAVCVNAQKTAFHTVRKKTPAKEVVAVRENWNGRVALCETDYDTSSASSDFILEGKKTDSIPSAASDVKILFSVPLESDTLIVNSPYGYRNDPITGRRKFHGGVDLAASADNVYAMMPGKVRDIGYNRSLGNYVRIDHGDMTVTYGHLLTAAGKKGDDVRAGQSVGITGSTGRSTGEHLHVAVKVRGKTVDPLPILEYITSYVHDIRDFRLPSGSGARNAEQ